MPNISSIMQTNGYKTINNFTVPIQKDSPYSLKWANAELSKRPIFYKQVSHPEMGRIGIYSFPEGLRESDLPLVLGRVEEIISSPKEKIIPDAFWGQRSPVFCLPSTIKIQLGDTSERTAEGLQFKGFLYKPLLSSEIFYPKMEKYQGAGLSTTECIFSTDGKPKYVEPHHRPYAAMIFSQAVFETFYARELSKKLEFVTSSFAFCEFEDQKFEDLRVGFSINFIEDTSRMRSPAFIKQVIQDVSSTDQKVNLLRCVFETMGMILHDLHKHGFSHGYPHLENFSFAIKNGLLMARLHDFDSVVYIGDIGLQGLFGRMLVDLIEVVSIPTLVFDLNKEGIDYRQGNGDMSEEDKNSLHRAVEMAEAFDSPLVWEADPFVSFFKAYFGDQGYLSVLGDEREFNKAYDSLVFLFNEYKNPFDLSLYSLVASEISMKKIPYLVYRQLNSRFRHNPWS